MIMEILGKENYGLRTTMTTEIKVGKMNEMNEEKLQTKDKYYENWWDQRKHQRWKDSGQTNGYYASQH